MYMVYDIGYRDLPHRCGAIMEYCFLEDEGHLIYFCSLCRKVVGYEKDGKRVFNPEIASGFKKKEYSDKTINDSK